MTQTWDPDGRARAATRALDPFGDGAAPRTPYVGEGVSGDPRYRTWTWDVPEPAPSLPQPPRPPVGRTQLSAAAPRRGRSTLAAALVAAVVSAGVAVPVTLAVAPDEAAAPTAAAPSASQDAAAQEVAAQSAGAAPAVPTMAPGGIAAVAERTLPSVARVDVASRQAQGSGSAVIYREDGYLVTNNHVVEGADEVQITLPDGTVWAADVVGTDPTSDLAVLRIEADDLPVPPYAEREAIVGETTIAVGSPFGLDSTVTAGIVSALGRSLPGEESLLVDLVQTDAAINPGNSGGALLDAEGNVIGINTAIYSRTGSFAGIGFAVPVTTVRRVADQLIDQGFVEFAQLGIQGGAVAPQVAEEYGLATSRGALVVDVVEGSAADEAGLEAGDIITAVDGEEVTSMADLTARIRERSPGDSIALDVVREDGQEERVEATLGGMRVDG